MFFDFNQIWIFLAVFRKSADACGQADGRGGHDEAKFYVIYMVYILESMYHPTYALCDTPFILF